MRCSSICAHARPAAAEDAFQETFLRALRGYDTLRHGRYLRAWVFTIATRVAADEGRKRRPEPVGELDRETADDRPVYAQIEHLADELPDKERAAVVLRYGYDLPYSDSASHSPPARRQPARQHPRVRACEGGYMTDVPENLDRRFRRRLPAGLLDVS